MYIVREVLIGKYMGKFFKKKEKKGKESENKNLVFPVAPYLVTGLCFLFLKDKQMPWQKKIWLIKSLIKYHGKYLFQIFSYYLF